jgi:hypothetical protein
VPEGLSSLARRGSAEAQMMDSGTAYEDEGAGALVGRMTVVFPSTRIGNHQ